MLMLTTNCNKVITYTDHQAYGPSLPALNYIQSCWKNLESIDINTEMIEVAYFGEWLKSMKCLQSVGFTHFIDPLQVSYTRNASMNSQASFETLLKPNLIGIDRIKICLAGGSHGDGLNAEDFNGLKCVVYICGSESYMEPNLPGKKNAFKIQNAITKFNSTKEEINALKNVQPDWF